jgi:electron transport complex protein RnfG
MSMKKDYVMPILVLSLLCLIVSWTLAFGNSLTQPVIEESAARRAEAARKDIIPAADEFELLHVEGLPKTVTEVYRATNNSGFIFVVTSSGYGGEILLICGITPDGKVIKTATLAQNETKGLGTPIFEEPHAGQYRGRHKDSIEDVAAISGATISSNALKRGIRDSFAAFEIVSLNTR